ncbi:conserved hypothetical protein [Alteromonas macleodii]
MILNFSSLNFGISHVGQGLQGCVDYIKSYIAASISRRKAARLNGIKVGKLDELIR